MKQSLVEVQRDYIAKIAGSCQGMKALIFDDGTVRAVSLVYLQSEGFKKDVYLFENIKNLGKEKISSLVGIFIIQPTETTLQQLYGILKNPIFKEVHLYFSQLIEDTIVQNIAKNDEYDSVKKIQEICFDYLALTPELMSSGKPHNEWTSVETQSLEKICISLSCSVLALHKKATIRYLNKSHICKSIAEGSILKPVYDSAPKEFDSNNPCLLIVSDRREDPVTPIVFDWSYISMINDLIHIQDNKVQVKSSNGEKTYNLFADEDEFLQENRYSNYGEVASNVERYLQSISAKKKDNQNIQSFEDMKKVLDSLPEMKKETGNLNKHYEIVEEIIKKVKLRKLLEVGEVEQSLVAKENKGDSFKSISDMIDDDQYSSFDLLRLCSLFSLKYEGDPKADQLIKKLRDRLGPAVGKI